MIFKKKNEEKFEIAYIKSVREREKREKRIEEYEEI